MRRRLCGSKDAFSCVTQLLCAARNADRIILRTVQQQHVEVVLRRLLPQPLQRIRDLADRKEILVEDVPLKVLNHLAPGNRHQGVIAFAKPVEYADLTDVLIAADEKGKVPFLVLLDGIEDVHNMGAIIRTAECAGVDAVLLPKRRTAPINETVGKTSAGAVEYMPLVQIGNIAQTLKQLKKRGFWVIGADMDGETDYFHSSLTDPVVLVIGSEGRGVRQEILDSADAELIIPMNPHCESLNAAVAATIVLWQMKQET